MGTEWNDQKTVARKCKYSKTCIKWALGNRQNKDLNDKAWADPEGGQEVSTPPEKSQKYRVSLQYWAGSPKKSQSYQASIQPLRK